MALKANEPIWVPNPDDIVGVSEYNNLANVEKQIDGKLQETTPDADGIFLVTVPSLGLCSDWNHKMAKAELTRRYQEAGWTVVSIESRYYHSLHTFKLKKS